MSRRDKPIPTEDSSGDVRTGAALSEQSGGAQLHYSTAEQFTAFDESSANAFDTGMQHVATAIDRKQEQEAKLWALNAASEAKVHWGARLKNQYVNKQHYDTDKFMEEYHDYVGKTLDAAPNPRARNMLLQNFIAMAPGYIQRSIGANAHAATQAANDVLGKMITVLGGDSVGNPDPANARSNAKMGQIAIDDSGADLPTKGDAQSKLEKASEDSVWAHMSQVGADAGLKNLEEGVYDGLARKERLDGFKEQMLQARGLDLKAAKYKDSIAWPGVLHDIKFSGSLSEMDEHIAIESHSLANAGDKEKGYNAAKLEAIDAVNYAKSFNKAHLPMLAMTEPQIEQYLKQFEPTVGDADYSLKTKLGDELTAFAYGHSGKGLGKNESYKYEGLLETRKEDPFGYGQQYSAPLKQAGDVVQSMAQQMAADPTNAPMKLPQLQAAQHDLIEKSLVYQSSLGIPHSDQQVMSKADAQNYSDRLERTDDIKGVMQAVTEIKERFGGYYPMAVKAMQQLPEKDHKLGAGYALLLANADNPVLTQKMAYALKRKPSEVNALFGEAPDSVDAKINGRTIKSEFDANPAYKAWKEQQYAGGRTNAAEGYVHDVEGALRQLTGQYVAEGKSISAAAGQAVEDTFGRAYSAVSIDNPGWFTGGNTVLAARHDEQGKPYDAAFLSSLGGRLKKEKGGLNDMDMAQFAHNPLASEQSVAKNSRWVSMPDNQGVYLVYTPDNGMPFRVLNKQGQPLTRRFSDMQNPPKVVVNPPKMIVGLNLRPEEP